MSHRCQNYLVTNPLVGDSTDLTVFLTQHEVDFFSEQFHKAVNEGLKEEDPQGHVSDISLDEIVEAVGICRSTTRNILEQKLFMVHQRPWPSRKT